MLKTTKSRRNLLAAAAVIVLLIFLHYSKLLVPAESVITGISRPVFSKIYSASFYIRQAYSEQTSKRDLSGEIKNLQAKVDSLTFENAKSASLEEENATLRQYLKFLSENKLHYVMADIISVGGLDSQGSGQTVIIDKGSKDGIRAGLAIVSGQGIIIGKITNVKDYLSEACLTTNRDCKLAATVENQDKTSGIAEGDLGLTIKMGFIPQTKNIKVGDIIVTSGLEQDIPRGLVIGSVSQVDKENNNLWQNATIEPLIDPGTLSIVSVLSPD